MKHGMHKFFNSLVPAIFITVGIAALVCNFWWQNHYLTTQNAHVSAHLVAITSPIYGQIAAIYVQNHAIVKRGQPLFQLDQTLQRLALTAAKDKLYQIQQQVKTAEETIVKDEKAINRQQETLSTLSKQAFDIHDQLGRQELTIDNVDDIDTQVAIAAEGLELAEQQLDQAYQAYGRQGEAAKKIKAAKAELTEAQLAFDLTTISAPADGVVNDLKLRPGTKISAKQTLFTLAEDNEWWVNADFRTSKFKRIKLNQHATIKFNQYPDHIFNGIVSTIYPQQENAAVVKVRILNPDPQFPLDVGTAGTVLIDINGES